MTKIKFCLSVLLLTFCFACGNNASKDKSTAPQKTDNTATKTTDVKEDNPTTENKDGFEIKAQFVEFTMGDAAHYMFKDGGGHDWDFGDIKDDTYKFAMELPKDKSNTDNQGWTSNKKLQGKWFNIKYVNKEQSRYQDGPKETVPVIIKIKEVE